MLTIFDVQIFLVFCKKNIVDLIIILKHSDDIYHYSAQLKSFPKRKQQMKFLIDLGHKLRVKDFPTI